MLERKKEGIPLHGELYDLAVKTHELLAEKGVGAVEAEVKRHWNSVMVITEILSEYDGGGEGVMLDPVENKNNEELLEKDGFAKIAYVNHKSEPLATVMTRGRIFFGRVSTTTFIKDFSNVELYYDRDAEKIGVRLLKFPTYNSLPISMCPERGSCTIYCAYFFKKFKIPYKKQSRSCPVKYDDKLSEFLEISMADGRGIPFIPRSQKKKRRK